MTALQIHVKIRERAMTKFIITVVFASMDTKEILAKIIKIIILPFRIHFL